MNPYIIYFIKSGLGMGIFSLAYVVFIKRERDFRFNRYYLLISALFATIIPLINPGFFSVGYHNPINQLSVINLHEVIIGNSAGSSTVTGFSWGTLLFDIYLIGLVFMSGRFFLSLFQLYRLRKQSGSKNEKGLRIIFPKQKLPVFSFFNWVFISKEIYENSEATSILNHERIHVAQKHSIDLIFLQLLCIFQWFNPFVYLFKKFAKENHEYLADEGISFSAGQISRYQEVLFRQASGIEFSPVTNSFNYSLLKKRMIMMKNQKSTKNSAMKITGVIMALMLALFACNNTKQKIPEGPHKVAIVTKDKKVVIRDETPAERAAVAAQVDTGQVFRVVEKMPKYPGGLKALMQYLATNIKYPEQAKKDTIQGRVFINFIVEKNGSVSHVKVLKGIGHGCDKEAVKVVKEMPHWIPGQQRGKPVRVFFNLPIKFTLE